MGFQWLVAGEDLLHAICLILTRFLCHHARHNEQDRGEDDVAPQAAWRAVVQAPDHDSRNDGEKQHENDREVHNGRMKRMGNHVIIL